MLQGPLAPRLGEPWPPPRSSSRAPAAGQPPAQVGLLPSNALPTRASQSPLQQQLIRVCLLSSKTEAGNGLYCCVDRHHVPHRCPEGCLQSDSLGCKTVVQAAGNNLRMGSSPARWEYLQALWVLAGHPNQAHAKCTLQHGQCSRPGGCLAVSRHAAAPRCCTQGLCEGKCVPGGRCMAAEQVDPAVLPMGSAAGNIGVLGRGAVHSRLPRLDGCLLGAQMQCMLSAVATVGHCIGTISTPAQQRLPPLNVPLMACKVQKGAMARDWYWWRPVLAWHWKCGCLPIAGLQQCLCPSLMAP